MRKKDARFFAEHGIVTQHIKDIAINFQKGEKMDDLISRKAAIEALVELWISKPFKNPALSEVKSCIDALPPVQPEMLACGEGVLHSKVEPRWIPVTERLPEKGQKCLVSDRGRITIDVFLGRGGVYNWQFYLRDYEAWMPLPEPYTEEKKK